MVVVLLLALLRVVLGHRSHDRTADGPQEAVAGFVSGKPACRAAGQRAEQTSVCFRHGRGVGVEAGRVRVGALSREFVLGRARLGLPVGGSLLVHAALVGLVLCVGVVAAVLLGLGLLLLLLLVAVVAGVALRIGGVILAVGDALLAVLEAARLGRTEGVRSSWRAEILILIVCRILLGLAVLWLLTVALRRVLGLLVVALGGVLRAVGLLAAVGIVRSGHSGGDSVKCECGKVRRRL